MSLKCPQRDPGGNLRNSKSKNIKNPGEYHYNWSKISINTREYHNPEKTYSSANVNKHTRISPLEHARETLSILGGRGKPGETRIQRCRASRAKESRYSEVLEHGVGYQARKTRKTKTIGKVWEHGVGCQGRKTKKTQTTGKGWEHGVGCQGRKTRTKKKLKLKPLASSWSLE